MQFPHFINNNIEDIASQCRKICNVPQHIKNKLTELHYSAFWFELYSLENSADEKTFKDITEFAFNILALPHSK